MIKHEVHWCIQMLEKALADYNITDANNYMELLKQWLNKSK